MSDFCTGKCIVLLVGYFNLILGGGIFQFINHCFIKMHPCVESTLYSLHFFEKVPNLYCCQKLRVTKIKKKEFKAVGMQG